ncbi:MAG: HlyD family efflux transporter periplasmic adaptor subunit [Eubacteriales bacterium]
MQAVKILKRIGITLLCVGISAYLIFQTFRKPGADIETQRADYTTRLETVETDTYVLRNEILLYPPSTGIVDFLVPNATRVAIDQKIANIYVNGTDMSQRLRAFQLENKLDILKRSNVNTDYVFTSVEKIDEQVQGYYLDLLKRNSERSASDIRTGSNEMLVLLNKRQVITRAQGSFTSAISTISSELETLKAQLYTPAAGYAGSVYSPDIGTVFTYVDGYESLFTKSAVDNMSVEFYNKLIASSPDEAIKNGAIGKLATDFDWYMMCKLDRDKALLFEKDKNYKIIYPYSADQKLSCSLYQKVERTDSDEVILIFKTILTPPDFDYSRKQTVQIVLSEISGLRVPINALRLVDGVQGVYVLEKGNTVVFKPIPQRDMLEKFENYYIISEPNPEEEDSSTKLALYDDIIVSGKDLYDGMIIE